MNKKTRIVLCVALAIILSAGGVFVACRGNRGSENTVVATTGADQTPEGTDSTTEAVSPTEGNDGPVLEMGVSDREDFDADTTPTTSPTTPTVPETTAPKPTTGDKETQTTEPTEALPPPDLSNPASVTYSQYMAMSDADKEAFVESFPSLRDFLNWRAAAVENEPDRETEILDGNEIDLGKVKP